MSVKLPPVRSLTQRKILLFFAENEGSIDTPRGVATWVNEALPQVRRALEDLARAGYLRAHRTSSTVAYSCGLARREIARLAAAPRR